MTDRTVTELLDEDENYDVAEGISEAARTLPGLWDLTKPILAAFAADLAEHPEVVDAFRERQRVRDNLPSDVDRLTELLRDGPVFGRYAQQAEWLRDHGVTLKEDRQ